jgi:hypothetical protein
LLDATRLLRCDEFIKQKLNGRRGVTSDVGFTSFENFSKLGQMTRNKIVFIDLKLIESVGVLLSCKGGREMIFIGLWTAFFNKNVFDGPRGVN